MRRNVLVRRQRQADAVAAASRLCVNVASDHGLSVLELRDVGAAHLSDPVSCDLLTEASEVAISVSSVKDYESLAPLLARASQRKAQGEGPPCVFYICQNEPAAGASLRRAIIDAQGQSDTFETVEMVIGKMSRTIRDANEISQLELEPGVQGLTEAWLVESYDEISISTPHGRFDRQLPRLTAYSDLTPFKMAKLNGHNAAHAALAYAGKVLGVEYIAEVMSIRPIHDLVYHAFISETGAFLHKKFADQTLFTKAKWHEHAKGLFSRMANPWLHDDCDRVGRSPERKLNWNDRLVGTIRLIESAGSIAYGWRLALHCAVEASEFDNDALTRLWSEAGASNQEINTMLSSQRELQPNYENWRREIGVDTGLKQKD